MQCTLHMQCMFGTRSEEQEKEAKDAFQDAGISITTVGKKHLGAALGSPSLVEEFMAHKVEE